MSSVVVWAEGVTQKSGQQIEEFGPNWISFGCEQIED
jgi:hypothetical protein